MEIRQLECFLACVRNRSLTLAAEELYMTQPHVSQIIKGLEQELGVQLFHRKAKGVELTEEGKRIYTYAVNAVKNARTVKDLCADVMPCIRVASNPSSHMAMLLTDYYRKQGTSGPVIEYFECGIEEMLQKIQEGACDLGFLFVPDDRRYALKSMLNRRYLEFVPLTKTEMSLLVFMMNESQKAHSRDSLLDEIWGFGVDVETRAIDETVRRIRKKLVAAKSIATIETVWGYGYKLSTDTN